MESLNFKIEGGKKLKGEVTILKAKNSAVSILCASLLNKGTTTLKKVPKIEEVFRIIEVLQSIGMDVVWEKDDLVLKRKKLNIKKINKESATKTRSAIMMIGSLIHEFDSFSIPHAGGCKLGNRAVAPHFGALQNFNVKIETKEKEYLVTGKNLKTSDFLLSEQGDTVTENAILGASRIEGETTIRFASCNYMVVDLCHFLVALGVKIEGIGTHTLKITGVKNIDKNIEFEMGEDPIEAMFFLSSAIVTNSKITIKRIPIDYLSLELLKLKEMGFIYKIKKSYLGENGFTNLVDLETAPSKMTALKEKIHPLPYPGINIDNLPFFAVIATQAEGETLIHDWVFEKRAIYYTELEKLGATVLLADPHRVFIKGKSKLKANEIVTPPALRPAAIILIAMLGAEGTSILRNVYSINRGYEDLSNRLRNLGAKINTF